MHPIDRCWRIELFGGLRVACGDRTITHFETRKTSALLALLALAPHRAHPREELAEQLWPDEAPETTRNRFKQALASLRRTLEPDGKSAGTVLIADRAEVRLDTPRVVTDVGEFEAALRAAAQTTDPADRARLLRTAVDLYRGDLLPGYYEDTILAERERLNQMQPGALGRLARALAETGAIDEALDYAHRAISADPLREESHGLLIRLYARAGRTTEALRRYKDLERLLREQLGTTPSARIRALIEPLQTGQPQASHPAPPSTPTQEPNAQRLTPNAAPKALPSPLTRFFGREEEIARLLEKLSPAAPASAHNIPKPPASPFPRSSDAARLVTLTGPGGSGKTRLALELLARLDERPWTTVWFVPLAEVTEARLILEAIAGAMDLPHQANADRQEQVCAALAGGPTLLALDNFEQVAEVGVNLVRLLLERVPSLTCLVTSRQRLDIASEWEFPVAPLPTPHHTGTPERLLEFASVQLFVDRAQAARADFALTRENAEAVAALCHRLEGLPLALELAAAWASVLTPTQILARLTRRFDLLVSRRKDLEPRHRSLRATVEWSYRLLGEDLQRFFVGLSVFRGGWTLEAAEAVCAEPLALDYLAQLRDRSLVVAEPVGAEMRFRLLETLREYAEAQATPDTLTALAQRHVRYYTDFVESVAPHWEGAEQGVWLDCLEAEYDNLRAAFAYLREEGKREKGRGKREEEEPSPGGSGQANSAEWGLRLAGYLWRYWYMRGPIAEGRQILAEILGRTAGIAPTVPRARALGGAGTLAWSQGDLEATQTYQEQCLEAWRALGDRRGIASALGNLAMVVDERGDPAGARRLHEESLAILRVLGDKRGIGILLNNLGVLAQSMHDMDAAIAYFEESLALKRETGDQRGISVALNNLGLMREELGDLDEARQLQEESLAIKRAIGDKRGIASSLQNLGVLALRQEDDASAQRLVEESLALKRELGEKRAITSSLNTLAALASKRGAYALARSLLEERHTLLQEVGNPRVLLGSLLGFASLASAEGQHVRAAQLLAALANLRLTLDTPLADDDPNEYDRTLTTVRAALGPDQLTAAWTQGSRLTLEQALACALQPPASIEPLPKQP